MFEFGFEFEFELDFELDFELKFESDFEIKNPSEHLPPLSRSKNINSFYFLAISNNKTHSKAD